MKLNINKKNKKLIYTSISLVLVIIALFLLALPTINDYFIKKSSEDLSRIVINELTAKDLKKNHVNEANFDFSSVRSIDPTKTWNQTTNYNRKNIIGQIVVPSVKMNLTLFKGLDENNLLAGVGTMKPNQKMGQGNYTIAGHHVAAKETLFNNLMNVKEGDVIRITDKEKIYVYKAVKIFKSPNDAINLIEDSEMSKYGNKPITSLMTCYYGDTSARWFVIGVLDKVIDYTPEAMTQA